MTEATGYTDSLGVEILIGDRVTITSWGHPVRLTDCGRTAVVEGLNQAGNLRLSNEYGIDQIARGRGVRPGYVLVARRDGAQGHEGNAR